MLGKLLKYELKHSARYVMTIYACAGAAVIFMLFGMLTKINSLRVIASIALYLIGIIAIVMTLVSVIKNFYDTLYGKQGYLTFTLPVKCSSLLFSKVLISFFWIILSSVLMAVIAVLVYWNAKSQTDGAVDSITQIIRESGLLEMLPSAGSIVKLVLLFAMNMLVNILVFVGFVYFAVTLANTRALQGHPKLFGFLIFFLTYGVANSINTKLTYSFPLAVHVTTEKVFLSFSSMDTMEESIASFGIGGTIFMTIVAVGLLFATGWIMEHKVNIK